MQQLDNFFNKIIVNFSILKVADILDILIVAAIIYAVISIVRRTSSSRVARGMLMLLIALGISEIFRLTMLRYLLGKTLELGLIAIVIIFRPELRRILERMGSGKFGNLFSSTELYGSQEKAIEQTVLACIDMARTNTGALIVFERKSGLEEVIDTGSLIDAYVSAELLRNIFFINSPLHDGAVIIRGGRIYSAGCMLPLSHNPGISRDLGMRHRSALGISETTDAICVVVSEETGTISIAENGTLKRHLSFEAFENLLKNRLISQKETSGLKKFSFYLKFFNTKDSINEGKSEEAERQ